MKGNFLLKVLFGLTALFVLVIALSFGLWIIAIPNSLIKGEIESSVKKPYKIEVRGIRKGIFFNVTLGTVKVYNNNSELITLRDCDISFEPVYLVSGKLKLLFTATLNGGTLNGSVVATKDNASGAGSFTNIDAGSFTYLHRFGIRGSGILSGTFVLEDLKGMVSFSIKDFSFKDVYSHGVYVPLQYFNELKGAIAVGRGMMELKSVTASGKGIFARVRGKVEEAFSDIVIEIMPEDDFPDKDKLAFIKQYEVSPGVYAITIKKKLL